MNLALHRAKRNEVRGPARTKCSQQSFDRKEKELLRKTGLIVAGLNHAMHMGAEAIGGGPGDPPDKMTQKIRAWEQYAAGKITQREYILAVYLIDGEYWAMAQEVISGHGVEIAATVFPYGKLAKTGAQVFFEGAKYSSKVLRQMSKADDIYHAFPKNVDGFAARFGKWTTQIGADGKAYQWLKVRGSYGGKTGTFEYIKDANGVINHRYFNIH